MFEKDKKVPKAGTCKIWIVLALVQLSYCIWHILAKKALMGGTHPLVIAFYREIIATICMYTLAYLLDGQFVWSDFELRNDSKQYLIMGCLSFGNTIGFIIALFYVTAFNASLLHPSIPIFSAIFGVVSGLEIMTKKKCTGILFCFIGAAVVVIWGVTEDKTTGGSNVVLGNIILIMQCACMGGLLVVQKTSLNLGCPPATLTARYYSIASLLTIITTLSAVPNLSDYNIFNSIEVVIAVIYGGTIGVSFVYIAMAWVVRESSPNTAAISLTLQPPFNAVLSMIFMNRTSFTIGEIIGGLLIMFGLVITVWAQSSGDNEFNNINGLGSNSEDGEIDTSANPIFTNINHCDSSEFDDNIMINDDDHLQCEIGSSDDVFEMVTTLAAPPPPPPSSSSKKPRSKKTKEGAASFTSPPRYIRKEITETSNRGTGV